MTLEIIEKTLRKSQKCSQNALLLFIETEIVYGWLNLPRMFFVQVHILNVFLIFLCLETQASMSREISEENESRA